MDYAIVSHAPARCQALKEVYLPESGVWLADYPYVNRTAFLAVSLDLERERRAAEPGAFVR